MAVEAFAHQSALAHYQRLISGTFGYEKILRTVQYFCHFLAWYLDHINAPQSSINFHKGVKKNFGSVRKAMRLTKFIDYFKLANFASNAKTPDNVARHLVVGRQLGYAFYMLLDNLTYPDSTGIRKYAAAETLLEMAHYAWLSALVCSIISGLYALQTAAKAAKKQKGGKRAKSDVPATKIAKYAIQLQLVSDLCDSVIVISILGLLPIEEGIVGLAGTLSSLIGLHAAWQKTA